MGKKKKKRTTGYHLFQEKLWGKTFFSPCKRTLESGNITKLCNVTKRYEKFLRSRVFNSDRVSGYKTLLDLHNRWSFVASDQISSLAPPSSTLRTPIFSMISLAPLHSDKNQKLRYFCNSLLHGNQSIKRRRSAWEPTKML